MDADPDIKQAFRVVPALTGTELADQHSYLLRRTEEGEETVIDPTWQQFLAKDKLTDELPKVLIGSRQEVVEQARAAGVPDAVLDYWKPLDKSSSVKKENFWRPLPKAA